MGTTKGELIKICYDNNETKLANIDVALPQYFLIAHPGLMKYWHVVDYNNSVLGTIRNLKDVAKENNIELVY